MHMDTVGYPGKQERVNFWIPKELNKKVKWATKEFDFSRSDLFRQALHDFLERLEREKINQEIKTACEFYYKKDQRMAEEWRAGEGRVSE